MWLYVKIYKNIHFNIPFILIINEKRKSASHSIDVTMINFDFLESIQIYSCKGVTLLENILV